MTSLTNDSLGGHLTVINAEEVLGKRTTSTHRHHVTIREENANAALEVMSRFAVNPNWLIDLPLTMSPCECGATGFTTEATWASE